MNEKPSPVDPALLTEGHLASGQAALIALESILLALADKQLLTQEEIVAAIEVAIDAKLGLLEDGERPEVLHLSVGMLKKIANSIKAAGP